MFRVTVFNKIVTNMKYRNENGMKTKLSLLKICVLTKHHKRTIYIPNVFGPKVPKRNPTHANENETLGDEMNSSPTLLST